MKEQLKLLLELQRHDARLQESDAIYGALPKRLAAQQAALTELSRILERERAELAENEAFRRELEQSQKETEQLLSRAKARLNQVRNSKESLAVQKEVDSARRLLDSREEEMKKLVAALGEQRQKIAEQEQKLAADRAELGEQEAEMVRRRAEIEAQTADARAEREQHAKRLRPEVLRKYNTIRQKRVPAVVAARNGTCSGCNMHIPPQLYNNLQRMSSLEQCPNCHRIIFSERVLEEDKAG